MRILHVFPYYGAALHGGAETYEYHLTQQLAARGAEVEVLTTCTLRPEHTSAFSSRWVAEVAPGVSFEGDVLVRRFPVSFSVPPAAGAAISRLIFRRWAHEARQLPDGDDPIAAHHRRALARPRIYDWLLMLARGPHAAGLAAALRHGAARADVVLAAFVPFATLWYGARAAAAAHRPFVVLPFFHPEDRYHHFAVFYRCFAQAAAVLAQSPYSATLLRTLAPGANPVQIGVGVDRAELESTGISGARFRARHNLEGKRVVLLVGRKEPAKRYDLAVDAVEALDDNGVVLIMIGQDVDGRPLASSRVRYLGAVDRAELLDAYDACDLFVLPSEHESFGIVFLEAWMRGKPVLGNRRCRPVASVIDDGIDGYLCDDAVEFAARIRDLLDAPERAATLGRAGRTKALEHYTWGAIGRRVHALCQTVSAQRAGEARA